MRKIGVKEAAQMGVFTHHEQMENGEYRFRLVSSDGSAYIRTEAPCKGVWQNSHSHRKALEVYVVQKGWIAIAKAVGRRIQVAIHKTRDFAVTKPGVVHNIYLSGGTVIHTVKYTETDAEDWMENTEFDRYTKSLSESDIRKLAKRTHRKD